MSLLRCFWINLPVGGAALIMQLFFLRVPKNVKPVPATWMEILIRLDISGFIILTASMICYTLALHWGGLTKPWSDGSVIATLVMWIALTIGFFANEWAMGDKAMISLHILKRRMTWSSCVYACM